MAGKSTTDSKFNQKRIWLGGGLVLVVAILAIGWFVAVGPVLTDTDTTRGQIASVEQQNTVLAAKNARLKAENDDVTALRDTLSAALAELPSDGGIPTYTRQLSAQATAHSVALSSVIVGESTEVAAAAAAAPAADVAGVTDVTAATATSGTGLMQLTVTVSASGLGSDLTAFLSDIQVTGPRRALVTAAQVTPTDPAIGIGPDAASTLNLSLTLFSAPMTADERAALEKLLSGS